MPRTWTREHGINLQTLRKANRWTIDQLARRANLDPGVVQHLERAETTDIEDEQVLRSLAQCLGVQPKQLCNSPLRPSRPTPSLAEVATAAGTKIEASLNDAAIPHAPERSGRSAAGFAVGTVAVLLIAAAVVPRACSREPVEVKAPAKVARKTPPPEATTPTESAPTAIPAVTLQQKDAALELQGFASPAPYAAAQAIQEALAAPPARRDAKVEAAAQDPAGEAATRIVILLVLGPDAATRQIHLEHFVDRALALHGESTPWDAPALESAIALGAATDHPDIAAAIDEFLTAPSTSETAKAEVEAARERAVAPRPAAPAQPEGAMVAATLEPSSATGDPSATDSPEAQPSATEAQAALEDLLLTPPEGPADVTRVLDQARATAAAGARPDTVRAALADWLQGVPREWLVVEVGADGLWRLLGWVLYPTEAPTWERAFAEDEDSWMLLVLAKLLESPTQ